MKQNKLNSIDTAFVGRNPFNDDSVFSETIESYKKTGETPKSLARDLYKNCFPSWSRDADSDFKPNYSQKQLAEYLAKFWNED